jgi:hypothetical protein
MKSKLFLGPFLPIMTVFIGLSIFIISAPSLLQDWNVDSRLLSGGNKILFLVTGISYWLYTRSLRNPNTQAFIRVVYGSMLIKMLVCLLAILLYVKFAGSINRKGIIGCFVLYIIYTVVEVMVITRLNKKSLENA